MPWTIDSRDFKNCCTAAALFLSGTAAFADQSNDTITVAAPWKISAPTPVESGTVYQRMGVTEPLTQPDGNGQIVGLLAESWEADSTLSTWKFRIRDGVVFHDGTALTAEIVSRNLKHFAEKSALRRAPIAEISAEDGIVVINLSRPFAQLPAYLAHWSTGIVAEATLEEGATEISATGFYKVTDRDGNLSLTLAANPDYWGEAPSIANASYQFVQQAETREAMVLANEAELAFGLQADAILKDHEGVDILSESTARIRALKINAATAPLSDPDVRQALSLAIDRRGIAKALLGNPDTAATQLFPKGVVGWHDPNLSLFAYDPEKAKAMLAEAGWHAENGGILEKDGEKLSFELMAYAARPELPEIATAVQAQLAEIGVEAKIELVDWTAIPPRHDDGTLEMAIVSDGFTYIPDPVGALAKNFSAGGGHWGSMGWNNAEFDTLVDQYQATVDPVQQTELRSRMMELIHQEQPLITITWYDETFAVADTIDGFVFDPYEMRYGLNNLRWSE